MRASKQKPSKQNLTSFVRENIDFHFPLCLRTANCFGAELVFLILRGENKLWVWGTTMIFNL